jgi:hypothetical protein
MPLYGITHYLPLREKTRPRSAATSRCGCRSSRLRFRPRHTRPAPDIVQTNLLVRVLEPENPRRMLRDLVMVRRALRANPALEAVKPLTAGRLVRIIGGPFQGVEGRVARLAGTLKVVLNVDMIGQRLGDR